VHGNVIQVYSSTTFENVSNLKGHNGKVLPLLVFSGFVTVYSGLEQLAEDVVSHDNYEVEP